MRVWCWSHSTWQTRFVWFHLCVYCYSRPINAFDPSRELWVRVHSRSVSLCVSAWKAVERCRRFKRRKADVVRYCCCFVLQEVHTNYPVYVLRATADCSSVVTMSRSAVTSPVIRLQALNGLSDEVHFRQMQSSITEFWRFITSTRKTKDSTNVLHRIPQAALWLLLILQSEAVSSIALLNWFCIQRS